jgi:acid phosphatase (class A)
MRTALLLAGSFFWITAAQAAMLDPASVDPARLLPPPPAVDSVDAKAEFQELHDIAKRSSPEMIAMAKRDAENETPTLFNTAVGFDIAALPQTSKLLSLVAGEEDADSKVAKTYFHRDRPYAAEPSLKTCTPIKPGKAANSYPSGHASLAFSVGIVLASLIPSRSQAILARASEYAENRLVCGVHFRSDIVAGQQFGTILALRLMQNPQFQAQMDGARGELNAAHPELSATR